MLILLLLLGNFLKCAAHSTMSCVSKEGATCAIEVRKNPYYFNVSPRCCGNGAATDAVECPAPEAAKGKLAAGSTFTVEWPARNHATPSQDPDGGISKGVSMYLAPATATTLGDYCGSTTIDENCPNKICSGSFGPSTCGGQNGDMVPCNLPCTIPANKPPGKYNILWLWDWRHNDGSMYSACGDIEVTAGAVVTPTPGPTEISPTPAPPTRRPTLPPSTLRPTPSGFSLPPTLPPTQPLQTASNSCPNQGASWAGFANSKYGIKFINVPKEVPFRACRQFGQELYYKKETNTLGKLVVDILDKDGEWHGKGVETIPGAVNGRTTVSMLIWEGKELDPALAPYKFKACFVDKSVYDAGVEDGSYHKDPMCEETTVESPTFCPGCVYGGKCDELSTTTCQSAAALNHYCPPTPVDRTKCPVDAMMRPILGGDSNSLDSSAVSNFSIIGAISALLMLICSL